MTDLSAAEKEEIKRAVKELLVGDIVEDSVLTLMTCVNNNKATVWERKCSPFFIMCKAVGREVFSTTDGNGVTKAKAPDTLESRHWVVPKLGRPSKHVTQSALEACNILKDAWGEMRESNATRNACLGRLPASQRLNHV